jgi:hypothetical protein
MDFERGLSPLESLEIGMRELAREWLDENDLPYQDIRVENSGTKEFVIVVYVTWHYLNVSFDQNGEINLPDRVKFRQVSDPS